MSEKIVAQAEPVPLGSLSTSGNALYAGQELFSYRDIVPGSRQTLASTSSGGPFALGSWPTYSRSNLDLGTHLGRAFVVGEQITMSQTLCEAVTTSMSAPVQDCATLPAPELSPPVAGMTKIMVSRSVPGSVIRVWSDNGGGEEIVDGSGREFVLERPLVSGEQLEAMQSLGSCIASTRYVVTVP
ncbi:MAG: hypothetical protein AAGF12_29695 [Myxococcota bacterium]